MIIEYFIIILFNILYFFKYLLYKKNVMILKTCNDLLWTITCNTLQITLILSYYLSYSAANLNNLQ